MWSGVVGILSRRSGSGHNVLQEVRDWLGGRPGGTGVIGSGGETLPQVREWSETHPQVRECSGDPPAGPGVVSRLSRRSGSSREALPKVRVWSGAVGRPSRQSKVVGRPSQRYGFGREWSGHPPGSQGVVGRPYRRYGSGREAIPEVRELLGALPKVRDCSGGPPEVTGVVASGWETHSEVWVWSGGPPRGSGVVGRPSQWSGSGPEAFPVVRE